MCIWMDANDSYLLWADIYVRYMLRIQGKHSFVLNA